MSKKKTKTTEPGQSGSALADQPVISPDPIVQSRYIELRNAGESHNFAEMLALQSPPAAPNRYSPMHPRAGRGRGY